MSKKDRYVKYDQTKIRNWTLYVIRLTNHSYYVGITSRKDFMQRIRQHGEKAGAWVNQNKEVEEIIEIHPLGYMSGLEAGRIENDMTLHYRKLFGARNVRGGYDVAKRTSILPTYTPGSRESIFFVAVCLFVAFVLLLFLLH